MKQGFFKYQAAKIPLYSDLLHVAIGHDIGAICTAADLPATDLNGLPLSSYVGYAFTGVKDGTIGYFAFFVTDATPGTIAHEALHLSHKIMTDRGMKVDAENDEAQAYLLGWLVNQIHDAFKNKGIVPTKKINLLS
jgi:hypothetical protein